MSQATLTGSTGAIMDAAMQPMAKATIVHTLHSTIAAAMLAEFGEPAASDSNKVITLHGWAMEGLTPAEFDQCMADALHSAKLADVAAGFKPADGAKGKSKYGPRQSTLATRASEMRHVFGCLRLFPDAIVKPAPSGLYNPDTYPAFSRAFAIARDTLKAEGVTWEGIQTETIKAGKAQQEANDTERAIKARAESNHPIKAGETQADYRARLASIGAEAEAREQLTTAAVDAIARKLLASLTEKHGAEVAEKIINRAGMILAAGPHSA